MDRGTMKVRMIGFSVEVPAGYEFEDFEEFLVTEAPPDVFQAGGRGRVFRAHRLAGHCEGLLLTLKPQRSLPQIETSTLEVTVAALKDGHRLVDFNFFRWNSATRRGLIMTYGHGFQLSGFEDVLQRLFEDSRAALSGGSPDPNRKKKGILRLTRLVSTNSLASLIDELSSISEIEIVGIGATASSGFAPLSGYVKRESVSLRIDPEFRESSKVKTAVKNVVKSFGRGRIQGKVDHRDRSLDFEKNYDNFGEENFDSAAEGVVMRLADWSNSQLLVRLRHGMSDHSDIFARTEVDT